MKLITARRPPSGSRIGRAMACIGSTALPEVGYLAQQSDDRTPSERGRVLHAFLFDVLRLGVERALALVPPRYYADALAIDLARMPAVRPESFTGEVAIAYDVEASTARFLGSGLERDYSTADHTRELCSTLDILGDSDEAAVIYDYKTGFRYLGRPGNSWQLRVYGLYAARALKRDRAVVGFIRINEEGHPYFSTVVLEPWDLDEIADLVRDMMARRAKQFEVATPWDLDLVEGDHCDGCPSVSVCPAKMFLARAMGQPELELRRDVFATLEMPALEPGTVAAARDRAKLVEKLLEKVDYQLRTFVRNHGDVQLASGKWWGVGTAKELEIDPVLARPLLDIEVANEAIVTVTSCSKTALEEAVHAKWKRDHEGKPKGQGAEFDRVVGLLVEKQAAKYVEKERFGERKEPARRAETQALSEETKTDGTQTS